MHSSCLDGFAALVPQAAPAFLAHLDIRFLGDPVVPVTQAVERWDPDLHEMTFTLE